MAKWPKYFLISTNNYNCKQEKKNIFTKIFSKTYILQRVQPIEEEQHDHQSDTFHKETYYDEPKIYKQT